MAQIVVCLALASTLPVAAHIVPPEELHPTAESYRRLAFLLERNPVLWSAVAKDAEVLADELGDVAPAEEDLYRGAVVDLLAGPIETPPSPSERRETAWRLFDLSTRAVTRTLAARLERAADHLGDGAASLELEQARQVWAAFEPTVAAADPEGFRAVGRRWLELSSALGSPGVFGVGAVEADTESFHREAAAILAYVYRGLWNEAPGEALFATRGEDAAEPSTRVQLPRRTGRLLPVPVHSPTYDAAAVLPRHLPPGHDINKQLPRPRQILNMATRGVDEGETPLVALGDMAFDSNAIYGEPARSLGISCNTCHNKGTINPKFVIPGLSSEAGGLDVSNNFFAPHANNGVFDPLDIPDLRGLRFTAPYGRNGRFDSLREFTRNVIVNEFGGPEPQPMLLDGLVAYMLEFDFLPNPFVSAQGRLTEVAPEAAKRGEEIFHRPFPGMDGRSCSSCHTPSDHFLDRKRHDVGTVHGAEAHSRDRALDTPTLLGVKYTAPYFHDGSATTLRAAVEHFDRRFELGLGEAELADLTAYVETVGEGIEAYEDTLFTLDAELEEFSFFLSTYEVLKARGERELIDVTFRTMAFEIEAHQWDVQDKRNLPTLDRLRAILEEACKALEAGEDSEVDTLVAAYRSLYDEHREVLR